MTEQEKRIKKYCAAVKRRLNLPGDVKKRVMNDFASSVAARMEAGETDAQIMAELGTPKEAAALINEQMKEYAWKKSPWRWAALGVAALAGLVLLCDGIAGLLVWLLNAAVNHPVDVGVIGGVDGPTAFFVTTRFSWEHCLIWVTALIMGILGWYSLSHMKKN